MTRSVEARFLDSVSLSGTRVTSDGYLVADVKCARSGCMDYNASELGLEDEGYDVVTLYRPPEMVFDKRSMESYAFKPVTLGHPPEDVTADNWKKYAVGDVGNNVARDGESISVSIKVMDQKAIKAIEGGTRQISMGSSLMIGLVDGVAPDGQKYQAIAMEPPKINHLAIVDTARGGRKLRIGDGADAKWGAYPTLTYRKDANMPNGVTRTVLIDGLSVETTEIGAQAIEKLQKQLNDSVDNLTAEVTSLTAQLADSKKAVETKDGEIAVLKKQLEDSTSPAAIEAAAKERATLLDAAKTHGLDASGMDNMGIRRVVVEKSIGDSAKTMSEDSLMGAFTVLMATKAAPKDEALSQGIKTNDGNSDPWGSFISNKEAH